jgi:hypothetical protein
MGSQLEEKYNWKYWICFQDVSSKTVSLTQETCQYLSGSAAVTASPGAALLGSRLLIVAELLSTQAEPPHVWISPNAVTSPRLTEALRFGMLEIQEHWETFLDRKDHAAEVFYRDKLYLLIFLEDITSFIISNCGNFRMVTSLQFF